jgi:mevalonate kinase
LDLRVALQGGCLFVNEQAIHKRAVPDFPMYLVNTGTPIVTTGQCVEKVAKHFQSSQMGDDFAVVTNAMDEALQQQSQEKVKEMIRENHKLLVQIGVVPEKVQEFILGVEKLHGAGKICGAGAVAGQQAGAVLVLTEDKAALNFLCSQFNYQVIPIKGETRGVYAA